METAMSLKNWERKVLAAPGAGERVPDIESAWRLSAGVTAVILFSAVLLVSCGGATVRTTLRAASSVPPSTTVSSPAQPGVTTVFSRASEPSTTLWSGSIPEATTSPTSSPYLEAVQPLLGSWQLASVTGPGSVDTADLEQGSVVFKIASGKPMVIDIHGLGGCSEFIGGITLKNGTVRLEEEIAMAATSCTKNVPALAILGRALMGPGAQYVVTGDRLVLSLPDGTVMNLTRKVP
jgi:heat shock protein HslJ